MRAPFTILFGLNELFSEFYKFILKRNFLGFETSNSRV